jgi:hypothetical protein
VAAALATNCASSPRPAAHFSGQQEQPIATAEQVELLGAVPPEAVLLGVVGAECTLTQNRLGIDEEWLSDVDCSQGRLIWALREKAASVGGTVLVDRRCESDVVSEGEGQRRVHLECEAQVARGKVKPRVRDPNEGAGNPPGLDHELSERVVDPDASAAWRILVNFRATSPVIKRSPLRGDLVHEHDLLPVDRVPLGRVVAHCERECSLKSVRAAVRIAAGRIGATDVVRTRCTRWGEGWLCIGTAARFERVPDFDPRLQ